MVDTSTKKTILQTILESQDFLTSKTYQKLLSYLVNISIKGESPKEYSIATDVFAKGSDFNPGEDTTVRVYLYNLRKKLEHYYKTEGKHDKVVMEIPKGHYEVRFVNRSRVAAIVSPPAISIFKVLVIVLIAGLLLLSIFLLKKNQALENKIVHNAGIPKNDPIWGEFLDEDRPVIIVLGDHFFYQQINPETQSIEIVRDIKINSIEKLAEYRAENPNILLEHELKTPYFAMNSVWPIADIIPVFDLNNIPFTFRVASKLTSHDLTDNDIIFVGSYKTLGVFGSVLNKAGVVINTSPDGLLIQGGAEDSLPLFHTSEGEANKFHKDICAIAKLPGPVGNSILILTSFHATGTCGGTQYLRNPETLKELQEKFKIKYDKVPHYFSAVLQVDGFARTSFQSDIVDFAQIDENTSLW